MLPMRQHILRLSITLFCCYSSWDSLFVDATTATLTLAPAYASMRTCAQDCYYYGVYAGPDYLAEKLGCDYNPIENECICRADLQDDGDAWLSSCVLSKSSRATVDLNSAITLYNNYCTSNGFTRDAVATPASTPSSGSKSSSSSLGPTAPAGGSNSGSSDSSSSATSSNSGGGGGLASGELIGIIVGVLGFVATSIGVCVSYRQLKQRREERARNAFDSGGGTGMGHQQHGMSYQMWPQHHPQGAKTWGH